MPACCDVSEFIRLTTKQDFPFPLFPRLSNKQFKSTFHTKPSDLAPSARSALQLASQSSQCTFHSLPSVIFLLCFLSLQRSVLHGLQLRLHVSQLRAEVVDRLNEAILRHGVNVLRFDK